MKKKITSLVLLATMAATSMMAQTTHFVTSSNDSGEGSLREIIMTTAISGDSIVISSTVNEIVLVSEIRLTSSKNLKINGQGATVRVQTPGVSTYRIFGFVYGGDRTVSLENLTLLGGDVSGISGNDERSGGAVYTKRASLNMKNCTVSKGKGYQGGGVNTNSNSSGAYSAYLENCVFSENSASNGYAAVVLNGTVGFTIKDCVIRDNNTSAGAPGIVTIGPATISNCLFKNNTTPATGEGSAALVHNHASEISVSNCTFEGNKNAVGATGTDGGSAFLTKTATKATFTNCTFYNNVSSRGALCVKSGAGELVVVNCTFAGNIGTKEAAEGSALYAGVKTTLVNNIFAYNYDASDADIYAGTTTILGSNNIIVKSSGGNEIPEGVNNITFTYNVAIPEEDAPLFANYTTNTFGKKIPVLDSISPTIKVIPLAANSAAKAAGIATFADVTIPTVDQRGTSRAAIPCLGSYEYIGSGGGTGIFNPITDANLPVLRLDVFDLTGKSIYSKIRPTDKQLPSNIPAGIYVVRRETASGIITEKLLVK